MSKSGGRWAKLLWSSQNILKFIKKKLTCRQGRCGNLSFILYLSKKYLATVHSTVCPFSSWSGKPKIGWKRIVKWLLNIDCNDCCNLTNFLMLSKLILQYFLKFVFLGKATKFDDIFILLLTNKFVFLRFPPNFEFSVSYSCSLSGTPWDPSETHI